MKLEYETLKANLKVRDQNTRLPDCRLCGVSYH